MPVPQANAAALYYPKTFRSLSEKCEKNAKIEIRNQFCENPNFPLKIQISVNFVKILFFTNLSTLISVVIVKLLKITLFTSFLRFWGWSPVQSIGKKRPIFGAISNYLKYVFGKVFAFHMKEGSKYYMVGYADY